MQADFFPAVVQFTSDGAEGSRWAASGGRHQKVGTWFHHRALRKGITDAAPQRPAPEVYLDGHLVMQLEPFRRSGGGGGQRIRWVVENFVEGHHTVRSGQQWERALEQGRQSEKPTGRWRHGRK